MQKSAIHLLLTGGQQQALRCLPRALQGLLGALADAHGVSRGCTPEPPPDTASTHATGRRCPAAAGGQLLAWKDAKRPRARSARCLPARRKGSSKPGLLAGTAVLEVGVNEKPKSFRKWWNKSAWVDSLPLPQRDRSFAVCSSGVPVLAISLLRQPPREQLLPEVCPAMDKLNYLSRFLMIYKLSIWLKQHCPSSMCSLCTI